MLFYKSDLHCWQTGSQSSIWPPWELNIPLTALKITISSEWNCNLKKDATPISLVGINRTLFCRRCSVHGWGGGEEGVRSERRGEAILRHWAADRRADMELWPGKGSPGQYLWWVLRMLYSETQPWWQTDLVLFRVISWSNSTRVTLIKCVEFKASNFFSFFILTQKFIIPTTFRLFRAV